MSDKISQLVYDIAIFLLNKIEKEREAAKTGDKVYHKAREQAFEETYAFLQENK